MFLVNGFYKENTVGQMHRADGQNGKTILQQLILWYPEFTVDLTSPNWFCPDVPQWHQEYVHNTNLSSKLSDRQVTQCRIVLYSYRYVIINRSPKKDPCKGPCIIDT